MCQMVANHVLVMKAKDSTLEMKHFVKETERSVIDHDESHESMMVNEADMDFRIQGLLQSVVKHA